MTACVDTSNPDINLV